MSPNEFLPDDHGQCQCVIPDDPMFIVHFKFPSFHVLAHNPLGVKNFWEDTVLPSFRRYKLHHPIRFQIGMLTWRYKYGRDYVKQLRQQIKITPNRK